MPQGKTSKIKSWIQPRRLLCLKKNFWNTPYTKGLLIFLRILPSLPKPPKPPKPPRPPKLPKLPSLPKLPRLPKPPKLPRLPNLPILTLAVLVVVWFCYCPRNIGSISFLYAGNGPQQSQPQPQPQVRIDHGNYNQKRLHG